MKVHGARGQNSERIWTKTNEFENYLIYVRNLFIQSGNVWQPLYLLKSRLFWKKTLLVGNTVISRQGLMSENFGCIDLYKNAFQVNVERKYEIRPCRVWKIATQVAIFIMCMTVYGTMSGSLNFPLMYRLLQKRSSKQQTTNKFRLDVVCSLLLLSIKSKVVRNS